MSNTTITEEGTYTFSISDSLGNTETWVFELDYTPFTDNYNYFLNNYYGSINHWWNTYNYTLQTGSNKNNYIKNQTFSFANYEMAKDYALKREYATVETGTYVSGSNIWSNTYNCYVDIYSNDITLAITGATYYIYKSPASATTYIAYFSEATSLQPIYTQYAIDSITEYNNITGQIGTAAPGEETKLTYNDLPLIYVNTAVSFNYKPTENIVYINSTLSTYLTTLNEDGLYHILEKDLAGNEFEYYLCIDTTPASFKVSEIANPNQWQNQLNNTSSIYVTESLKVSANDQGDSNAILVVELEDGSVKYIYNGNSYEFNKTGIYIIKIVDTAKNITTSKTITVSYETPSIVFEDNLDSEQSVLGFSVTFIAGNKYNKLSSISIQKYNEETGSWENEYSDSNGTVISNQTTSYYFTSSGQYLVHWIDNFGRNSGEGITYLLERDKPKGYLMSNSQTLDPGTVTFNPDGSINQIYPSITKNSVYLTWEDEPGNRLTGTLIYKNGTVVSETYYKDNFIKDAGTYIIRLTNNDNGYKDFVFTIDKTAPIGTVKNEKTDEIITASRTNNNVYFTWVEDNCVCYYTTSISNNKMIYYKGTVLSEELTYTFYLYDGASNESIYEITLDFTPPSVTIYSGSKIIPNNSFTNGNVKFVFNEKNVTATLNGDDYISGTVLSKNIQYILTISDSCGNTTNYKVTRDATPITIQLKDENMNLLSLNNYMNKYFRIYASKEECEYYLNGFEYIEGTLIELDSSYEIYIIDKYGNTYKNTIVLDTVSPNGVLTTTQEGGFREENITNGNVTFSTKESKTTITLDGSPYSNGTLIKTEGTHTIVLTDLSGNSSIYTFTIDKTMGIVELNGVTNGGHTNTPVSISWQESSLQVFVNGIEYEDGTLIEGESEYLVQVIDTANNISNITFTIDKTAPIGELITSQKGGFREGNLTSGNVTFTWTEKNMVVLLDDTIYVKGTLIKTEGPHTIKITDLANNTTTYEFSINKEYPFGLLNGVANGGSTSEIVTFTWDAGLNYTATLNGDVYINGNSIEFENTYELILLSPNGLTTLYTFTIDKTAPIGELITSQKGGFREGNITSGNVSLVWNGKATALLNGEPYTEGTSIRTEGTHIIELIDECNNSSTYTFTIDKTVVQYNLTGVENDGVTSNKVTLEILENNATVNITYVNASETSTSNNYYYEFDEEENYYILLTDQVGNECYISFEIDRSAPVGILTNVTNGGYTNKTVNFTWQESKVTCTLNNEPYTKGASIREEKTHQLVLTDACGNSTTYTFTIDKTPVEYTAWAEFTANNKTKDSVIFTWEDSRAIALVNNEPYLMGTKLEEELEYVFIISDLAGNVSTFNFIIDKTPIEYVLTGVENGSITPNKVSCSWLEKGYATLNGEPYTNGSTIKNDNIYELIIYDECGNASIIHFEINTKLPTVILEGVENEGYTNENVKAYWLDDEQFTATLNGEPYTKHTLIIEEGFYELIVSSNNGLTNKYTFTIDKTAPSITLIGVVDGYATTTDVTISWEENVKVYLNNVEIPNNYIVTESNIYSILVEDLASNQKSYSFEIDKVAPNFAITGLNSYSSLTNETVIIVFTEENVLATLNGDSYISGTPIEADGEYTFYISDQLGNFNEIQFIIDKTAPVGELVTSQESGFQPNNYTNGIVTFTCYEENVKIYLNDAIYKNGTAIKSAGSYRITIIDAASNINEYLFTIDLTNPQIVFIDENDNTVSTNSNFTTKENIKICATTENTIIYVNNSLYDDSFISAEDIYDVKVVYTLTNKEIYYTFTIDKTAPIGELITTQEGGFRDGNITNGKVNFIWTEPKATCTLNNEPYSNGTVISKNGSYIIVIKDAYGNTREYSFTIDLTKPQVEFTNEQGEVLSNATIFTTNENVIIRPITENTVIYVNETEYEFISINEENEYIIRLVYTPTGQESYYTFNIDKTAPIGELITTQEGGFRDGNITNGKVSLVWDESKATAKINGEYYSNGMVISKANTYVIELTDIYGNTREYVFTIDLTIPEVEFINENNETVYNSNNFTTNENIKIREITGNTIIYVNDEEYTYDFLTDEGIYNIKLVYTPTGQEAIYTFTIDKTEAVGILTTTQEGGFRDGNITNGNVSFSWDEKCIVTLNGEPYTKGTLIKKPGIYTISITDNSNNTAYYQFEIDLTIATIAFADINGSEVSRLTNYETANNTTLLALTHNTVIYVNNTEYKSSVLTDEAIYEIKAVYTPTGQESNYKLIINKNLPKGTLIGVVDGGITSGNVSFVWDEVGATAMLNNSVYTKGSSIKNDGEYEIILTNKLGLSVIYTFTINKQFPEGTLNGVTNGGYTNTEVYLTWESQTITAELNGEPYINGSSIIEEGEYSLVLNDVNGLSTTYTFTIDKTKAEGILTTTQEGGFKDGNITNGNVTFICEEPKVKISLNDEPYISGSIIKKADSYTIKVEDLAKNVTEYTFVIDLTNPTLKFTDEADNLLSENIEYETAKKIKLVSNTSNTVIYVNEEVYDDDELLVDDATYNIKLVYTPTGQESNYKLIINTTAPTGVLTGVENGGITANNVTFNWDIVGCTCTVNGVVYTKGSTIRQNNSYEVILTNKLGVSSVYTFTINKEAPEGTLNGVTNGGYTNTEVYLTWESQTITAELNGEPYINGSSIIEEGEYSLVLNDVNGLSTTYTFTIDKTKAEGILTTTQEGGFKDGNITNGNVTFICEEPKVKISLNDEPYISGSIIKKADSYTIKVEDLAKNVTEYTFVIDLTNPTLKFTDEADNLLSENIEYETAKKIKLVSNTSNTVIYVNEEVYDDDELLVDDATYNIKLVYTPTGQESNYKLIINTTAPTGVLTGVENGGITAENVSFNWDVYTDIAVYKHNDLEYIPYTKGTKLRENGTYEIILTNKLGVSSVYTFTINKDNPLVTVQNINGENVELKLDQYINYDISFNFNPNFNATLNDIEYISDTLISEEGSYTLKVTNPDNLLQTVYVFTIDKTAPALVVEGVDLEVGLTNQTVELSWTKNEAALYVNDEKVSTVGNYKISTNGTFSISLVDLAGNVTSISFERQKANLTTDLIVSEYKQVNEETGQEEIIQDDMKSNYTKAVKFVIGNELKTYLIYINEETGEEVVVEYNGEELTENREYKLRIEDKYGNTSTFKFKVNIDHSVENPNFLTKNLATIAIFLVPTIIILCFVFYKFKSKHSNPFAAKKKKKT